MNATEVYPVASGWQWRAYIDAEDGKPATAEKIKGGWAATEAAAERNAREAL